MIPCPKKSQRFALLLLAALPVSSALAAQTAVVRGTPQTHASPSADAPLTGTLPQGAMVTLEQCSGEGLAGAAMSGAAMSGAAMGGVALPRLPPGAGDWCLVRGVGWVEATALLDITADPRALLPGTDFLDPLKDASPAWDDLSDPDD
ncbi:MAG: hypothetical protein ACOH2L_17135 [Devosia sp.]